jgi:hypothetical protein
MGGETPRYAQNDVDSNASGLRLRFAALRCSLNSRPIPRSEDHVRIYRWIMMLALLFPFVIGAKGQTISCSSAATDSERHYCEADTRHGARLVKQTSAVECAEGKTWGWDEEGIWVDQGCAGEFALRKADADAAPEHPPIKDKPATPKEQRISCTSNDGRRNYCDADLQGATVQLVRQSGASPCMEGSTWGHDDKQIWVDRGCRGEFVILTKGEFVEKSCDKTIGKKAAKVLVDQCVQISPATHPPCNAANSCVLIKEEIKRSCGLREKDAPKFCEEFR